VRYAGWALCTWSSGARARTTWTAQAVLALLAMIAKPAASALADLLYGRRLSRRARHSCGGLRTDCSVEANDHTPLAEGGERTEPVQHSPTSIAVPSGDRLSGFKSVGFPPCRPRAGTSHAATRYGAEQLRGGSAWPSGRRASPLT
jgi:hypothetical protein